MLVFVQLVYDGLKTMILKHHPAWGGSRVGHSAPLLAISMPIINEIWNIKVYMNKPKY